MLSKAETDFIISELSEELNAKRDGSGKNLIAEQCPFCGKEKKIWHLYRQRNRTQKAICFTLLFLRLFNLHIGTIA